MPISPRFESVSPRLFLNRDTRRRRLNPRTIQQVERRLGVRLPDAYLSVLQEQNGGDLKRDRLVVDPEGDVAAYTISNLLGVGGDACASIYTQRYRDEDMLPPLTVLISSGETPVFLDYRDEGPQGEPTVVCGNEEYDDEVATHFGEFVQMLRMYEWRYVIGLSSPHDMQGVVDAMIEAGLRFDPIGDASDDELLLSMARTRANGDGEIGTVSIERHFRRQRADKEPLHSELVGSKWLLQVNVEKKSWPRVSRKLVAAFPGALRMLCEPLAKELRVPRTQKKKARGVFPAHLS